MAQRAHGVPGAAMTIRAAVASWPGTRDTPHRFGGIEFLIGEREIGHLHGDRLLDVPFPRAVHDELIANGKVPAAPCAAGKRLDQLLDRAGRRRGRSDRDPEAARTT